MSELLPLFRLPGQGKQQPYSQASLLRAPRMLNVSFDRYDRIETACYRTCCCCILPLCDFRFHDGIAQQPFQLCTGFGIRPTSLGILVVASSLDLSCLRLFHPNPSVGIDRCSSSLSECFLGKRCSQRRHIKIGPPTCVDHRTRSPLLCGEETSPVVGSSVLFASRTSTESMPKRSRERHCCTISCRPRL